jgi:hypothetical protein
MAGYNNGGKDACGGDSGGPLAVPVDGRYKLAGLVSWGSDQCNSYGGFVRVSSYLDWIEEVSGVGSLFRPASPLGDLIVCPAEQQSVYQTSISPPAQSFEWELQPAAAGTVESIGSEATVNWNPTYSGNTTLRVRAVRNDSLSGWSLINISRPVETTITFQPGDATICQNENVTLDIDAIGSDLLYTWFRDGAPVATGINSEYFIEDAQPDAGGVYAVEIEGTCGTVFSEEIDLTVHPLTEITSSSLTTRTYLGGSAVIEVQAVGNDLEYSWTKDNIPLEGINTPELFFTDADAEDIGRYRAIVSGTCGEAQSNSIYLYVSQDPGFTGSEENAILWPSLNDGEFFIALNSGRLYDVYLYDTSGKVAAIWEENQYHTRLVKRGLPTGIYIVRLLMDDYSQSFRIFIQ